MPMTTAQSTLAAAALVAASVLVNGYLDRQRQDAVFRQCVEDSLASAGVMLFGRDDELGARVMCYSMAGVAGH